MERLGNKYKHVRSRSIIQRVALLSMLLVGYPSLAADKLVLGVFCPSLPFPSPTRRVQFADDLAKHLSHGLNAAVTGIAFARAIDLDAHVRAGAVHLVVADPMYLAGRTRTFEVIAVATRAGRTSVPWVLTTLKRAGNIHDGHDITLADLEGKTVLVPSIGQADEQIISNHMFGAELTSGFFTWLKTPNTTSAVTALKLGKAKAALVPSFNLNGLSIVVTTFPVPLPILAAAGRVMNQSLFRERAPLDKDRLTKIISAFSSVHAGIDGWSPTTWPMVAGILRRPSRQPLLSQSTLPALRPKDLFSDVPYPWELSPLIDLLPPAQGPP